MEKIEIIECKDGCVSRQLAYYPREYAKRIYVCEGVEVGWDYGEGDNRGHLLDAYWEKYAVPSLKTLGGKGYRAKLHMPKT